MGIGGPKAKRGVVTPWGVGEILKQSNDAASLLRLIPGDLELQDVDEAEFHGQDGPMDAARTLWYLTAKALGTNEKKTISTWKVLAGKRPHLFPVRDTDVLRALRTPRGWWKEWWQTLSFDPGLVKRARDIHATSTAVPASPSVLRICDVVVWMSAADRGTCGQH